ncbi:hypothetical protein IMCC1989_376 [gamma proteobacterium IMCC1989]|nr:hypothetical protein IMCC1989_376 [gamma proteobacterium IMCC1989]
MLVYIIGTEFACYLISLLMDQYMDIYCHPTDVGNYDE